MVFIWKEILYLKENGLYLVHRAIMSTSFEMYVYFIVFFLDHLKASADGSREKCATSTIIWKTFELDFLTLFLLRTWAILSNSFFCLCRNNLKNIKTNKRRYRTCYQICMNKTKICLNKNKIMCTHTQIETYILALIPVLTNQLLWTINSRHVYTT